MTTNATTKKISSASASGTRKSATQKPERMIAEVYNVQGKKTGTIELPPAVFGAPWNADLVHGVVHAMQSNARAGTAHAKDRSEVRGGGRKPWKQKGTGRARHGSRRSPIWTGGGVTHGPRKERDYSKKINKNARARALASVLSKKYEDGEVIFVGAFDFTAPKARDAKGIIAALGGIPSYKGLAGKKRNAALVVLPARDVNTEKSFHNFGNMLVGQAKDISPVDLLSYKYLIVAEPENVIGVFSQRAATKTARLSSQKGPFVAAVRSTGAGKKKITT